MSTTKTKIRFFAFGMKISDDLNFCLNAIDQSEAEREINKKWFPYNKGGEGRWICEIKTMLVNWKNMAMKLRLGW